MKQTPIAIFIFFLSSCYGYSKPIQFDDFTWGMRLLEVEAQAAESNSGQSVISRRRNSKTAPRIT